MKIFGCAVFEMLKASVLVTNLGGTPVPPEGNRRKSTRSEKAVP